MKKAKIEIQNTDKNGNQMEISKKITPNQAARAMKASGAQGPRSVFAGGKGRRPKAVMVTAKSSGGTKKIPKSCFAGSRGGPQDGSGPLGGTEFCPNS